MIKTAPRSNFEYLYNKVTFPLKSLFERHFLTDKNAGTYLIYSRFYNNNNEVLKAIYKIDLITYCFLRTLI